MRVFLGTLPCEQHPKVPTAKTLAHHSSGHFWEPVIESAEQRENRAPDQNVVEMRDYEIGVVNLKVERYRCQHHAGHAAQYKDRDEPVDEVERRGHSRPAGP